MKKIVLGFLCALSIVASGVYAESYGPTTKNDSLLTIAAKVKPSGDVSAEQAAIGIYYYNQSAFSRDNINSLIKGKYLEIPNIKVMKSITKEEAAQEVAEHNAAWEQRNKKVQQPVRPQPKPEDSMVEARRISSEFDPEREVAVEEIIQEAQYLESKPVSKESEVVKIAAQDTATEKALEQAQAIEQENSGIFTELDRSLENIEGVEVTNVSVTELDDRLKVTQNQMADIDERMALLETKMNDMSVVKEKLESCAAGRFIIWLQYYYDQASDYIGPILFMVIMALVILILLVLLIYMIIPKKRAKTVAYPHEVTAEDEFTHIEHEEDATSKLNLAHAYLEMRDMDKARTLLNEVLLYGSELEQLEAKDLLAKIKNDDL